MNKFHHLFWIMGYGRYWKWRHSQYCKKVAEKMKLHWTDKRQTWIDKMVLRIEKVRLFKQFNNSFDIRAK